MPEQSNGSPPGIEDLFLRVNGRRVHYRRAGDGPPVVLVHGGASDSRDWLNTMAALSGRYCLYAPDLIGFGQSDRDKDGYYLSDFIDFLLGFIDTLHLEKPALLGHSFGALVCLDAALRNDGNIRKLVLVDAAGLGDMSRFGTIVQFAVWKLRRTLHLYQPFPEFLTREGEEYPWLYTDDLPTLKTPTLLIWKRHDPYLPVSIARKAVKLIPDARLAVLPGFGHAPHEQNAAEFNRLLLDFLDAD